MLSIPFDQDLSPKTWKGAQTPTGRTALLKCSNGHIASLSNHEISTDGVVTPSVVCPHEGCNFHEMVTLEDWKP